MGREKTKLQKHPPPDSVVNTNTKSRRIIVETTIENRTTVYELTAEDVGASVVQAHSLGRKKSKDKVRRRRRRGNRERVKERVSYIPCPKRKQVSDHCDWRSGDWKCRRREDLKAPGQQREEGRRS